MLFLEAILADVGLDGVAGDEALNEATEGTYSPMMALLPIFSPVLR